MCVHLYLCVYLCLSSRIPLIKGKSARDNLEEQGLWEMYRNKYPYNAAAKFDQQFYGNEPMTNDFDVRIT